MDSKDQPTLQDELSQGCFLCLQDEKQGHVAVWVPFDAPHAHKPKAEADSKDRVHLEKDLTKPLSERDSGIWRKLVQISHQFERGGWKRHVPGYDISAIHQATFRITGPRNNDGSYPASVSRADIDQALDGCNKSMDKPVAETILERFCLIKTAFDPSITDKRPALDSLLLKTCLYESRDICELMTRENDGQVLIRGLLFTKGFATRPTMIYVSYTWLAVAAQRLYQCLKTPKENPEFLPEATFRIFSAGLGALLWVRDSRKRAAAATNRQPGEALYPMNGQPRHHVIITTYFYFLNVAIFDMLNGFKEQKSIGSVLLWLVDFVTAFIGIHVWYANQDACTHRSKEYLDLRKQLSLLGGEGFFKFLVFWSWPLNFLGSYMRVGAWWIRVFSGDSEENQLNTFPWKSVGHTLITYVLFDRKREAMR